MSLVKSFSSFSNNLYCGIIHHAKIHDFHTVPHKLVTIQNKDDINRIQNQTLAGHTFTQNDITTIKLQLLKLF